MTANDNKFAIETYNGSSYSSELFSLDGSGNTTFAGTINAGAITSSGDAGITISSVSSSTYGSITLKGSASDSFHGGHLLMQTNSGATNTFEIYSNTTNTTISSQNTLWATITGANVTFSGAVSAPNLSGTNTGDQTITLTGNVTGSGTGSFATTIASGVVTNAMLAGSIASSKLVGTDIATVGTITTGAWNAGAVTSTGGFTSNLTGGSGVAALSMSYGNYIFLDTSPGNWVICQTNAGNIAFSNNSFTNTIFQFTTGAFFAPAVSFYGGETAGHTSGIEIQSVTELLTITGITTVSANSIPANAVVFAIPTYVTTTFGGAVNNWELFGNTSSTQFSTLTAIDYHSGTSDTGLHSPMYNQGTSPQHVKVVCSMSSGSPTGGQVRITIYYYVVTPPSA